MPFDNVEALKDPARYKAILKAELAKVKTQPVKFQYFENFPFAGKAGPLVIVGPYKDDFIDGVKDTGAAFKAKGRCLSREEKLVFSADQGTLKADKLNLALKVAGEEAQVAEELGKLPEAQVVPKLGDDSGRDEVLGEPRASGEVVDAPGGQRSATDTDKARAKLPALVAAFDKLKARFTQDEREKFRAALHAANELVKADQGAAAVQKIEETRAELEKTAKLAHPERDQLPAAGVALARQANQAEKDIQSKEAEGAAKLLKAQKDIDAADAEAKAAAKAVADLEKQKSGMRRQEFAQKKQLVDAALKKTSDTLAQRKLQLAMLAKDPVPANALKPLLERYAQARKEIAELEQRMAKLAIDAGGDLPAAAPGQVTDNPGLAQARDHLAAQVGQQAGLRAKIVAALKKQRAAIGALDARWQVVVADLARETGAQVDPKVLGELERLRQARDALELGKADDGKEPVRDLGFDATFDADAQVCAARIGEAEKALAALQEAGRRSAAAAQRHAQFAQRTGRSGVQLAPSARGALDAADLQLAALKQKVAQAPFGVDSGALDAALVQAGQRLDAAEPALQALETALAQAAAPVQRFDQLAQRVTTVTGHALDAQARGERAALDQRLQSARQGFGQALAFDGEGVSEAQALLETRCASGEAALKQLESALAGAGPEVAAFAGIEPRIAAVVDAGALDPAAVRLRTNVETALDDARRAVARTLQFDESALAQARSALSGWVAARAKVLDEVERRQLRSAYDKALGASPQNAVLLRGKQRLDTLLCAAAAPPAAELKALFKTLAPADDGERLDASKERDRLVEQSKTWGKQAFTNALLKRVWTSACKVGTTGGSGDSIQNCTLEEVEAAIPLWQAASASAAGAVSNLHVPGGGRPQYKHDKNPTRRAVEANFMSLWAGKAVNVHVGIVKANNKDLHGQNGINNPLVNELATAGRINRS